MMMSLSHGEDYFKSLEVIIPRIQLENASVKNSFLTISNIAEAAGATQKGFKGFVFGVNIDKVQWGVSLDVKNVTLLDAVKYIAHAGRVSIVFKDGFFFIDSPSGSESVIFEIDDKVSNFFGAKDEPKSVSQLIKSLRSLGFDVNGDSVKVISNSAMVTLPKEEAEYFDAIIKVVKRGDLLIQKK